MVVSSLLPEIFSDKVNPENEVQRHENKSVVGGHGDVPAFPRDLYEDVEKD